MDAERAPPSTCLASTLPVLVLALTCRSLHMPWCSTASLGIPTLAGTLWTS